MNEKDHYLNESISEVDTVTKIVSPSNVAIKGGRVELSHDEYLVYAAVDAVAHRDINKSIASPNRNLSNAHIHHVSYFNA